MSVKPAEPPEYVVLYDVSWEAYEKLLEALPEHHLRHTYDRGTLEIRALNYDVDWRQYEAILEAFGDHSFPHTYYSGTLEILMSPRMDHDWIKTILGRFVESMCLELAVPIKSIGSTTLRQKDIEAGLQPDEAYYVSNEPQMRGKRQFRPGVDPPPDLVIEVDVTHKSLKRLPVYAALGVSEVWRHDGESFLFYRLKDGKYVTIRRSRVFPLVTVNALSQFLDEAGKVDETTLVRSFLDWIRTKAKPD